MTSSWRRTVYFLPEFKRSYFTYFTTVW